MSIEKRFYMIPCCVIRDAIFNRANAVYGFVKEYDGFTELTIDNEKLIDKATLDVLDWFEALDKRFIEGLNRKEFSDEEIKKFGFIKRAFCENAYNFLRWRNDKWYIKSFKDLVFAYGTMAITLRFEISDRNSKDFFKPFFRILNEFDFFNYIKTNYSKEFKNDELMFSEIINEK